MAPCRTTWSYERALWAQGFLRVAGVDEVGLGCLAGPVVAAAVILPPRVRIDLIRDSKTLSPAQRERIAKQIRRRSVAWAVGEAAPEEIAALNIRRAAVEAMKRALAKLSPEPDAVLVDAFHIPGLPWYHQAVIKGDQKIRSVAAASILAKVHRDALMVELDREFPAYGFAVHKGYATSVHRKALKKLGPCPIHRPSFAPVRLVAAVRTS